MSAYGDEIWRLATAGDVDGLRRAAALLDDYDARRAVAFALAIEGRIDEALTELEAGAAGGWPFPAAHAVDTSRAHYLARDDGGALCALTTARTSDVLDPAVAELAAAVARRSPRLRAQAVRVVLGAGSVRQRLRNAVAVLTGS
jgi:hypothetical protein